MKNVWNIYSKKYLQFKTQSLAHLSLSAIQFPELKTKKKKVNKNKMTTTRLNLTQYARRVATNLWIHLDQLKRMKFKNIYRHPLEMEAIYKNYFKILIERISLLIIRNPGRDLWVSPRLLGKIPIVRMGFITNDLFYIYSWLFLIIFLYCL